MKIHILPLLSIVLLLTVVGRAFALSNETMPIESTVVPTKAEIGSLSEKPELTSTNPPKQCVNGEVLKAINAKMLVLTQREDEMLQKESAFSSIEIRLQKQLSAIEAAKKSLDDSVSKRTTLADNDISHLTNMYTTMKPKQAALIFNKMDPNFAAGFLREMKSGQAGLILANMDTKQAYQISLIIASKGAKYRVAKK